MCVCLCVGRLLPVSPTLSSLEHHSVMISWPQLSTYTCTWHTQNEARKQFAQFPLLISPSVSLSPLPPAPNASYRLKLTENCRWCLRASLLILRGLTFSFFCSFCHEQLCITEAASWCCSRYIQCISRGFCCQLRLSEFWFYGDLAIQLDRWDFKAEKSHMSILPSSNL